MMAAMRCGTDDGVGNGNVAIAGLGGLGSNIAIMLARAGVGTMLIVDFDTVEMSNLNRQHYDMTHIGMLKTEALKSQIAKINPSVKVETKAVKVTGKNALGIFKDYDIVCEAFDDPRCKAALVNALIGGGKRVVAASGMAGIGSSNNIVTKRAFRNLYVCGDHQISDGAEGFTAPRVVICAGHQANMVLRLLSGMEEE